MIINFNKEKRQYILNECEKQEIEKIYTLGGRYFYCPDIEDIYVRIYDNNKNPIPGNEIITVYGDTVQVLRELAMEYVEELKNVFDIMQLYVNSRQINLTQSEKMNFRYIYEKIGGRYIRLSNNKREVIIYNDDYKTIGVNDNLDRAVFNMTLKAADEIFVKGGYISVEKILNKFCN